ncbi:MAG: hypothetical protein NT171_06605 [Planctomycetota bacterium]|nr:hypothetical protein [Planctomycetota bacterium]
MPKRFLLREWVVRPMQENLGETPAEAIRPGSKFLRVMANITPETAVTLWCYPYSFEAFRAVREELHRRGLPTAGRPLPGRGPDRRLRRRQQVGRAVRARRTGTTRHLKGGGTSSLPSVPQRSIQSRFSSTCSPATYRVARGRESRLG